MSWRRLILVLLAGLCAAGLAAVARADSWPSSGSSANPFSYDTLHPGSDLNPHFPAPSDLAQPKGALAVPPALTPHQDCISYHQQMTRDQVYPYQSGPCLPGDQK